MAGHGAARRGKETTNLKLKKGDTSMTDGKKHLYFGGVPTEPDIKKLREIYPPEDLKPGRTISYIDVAKVIGEPYGSTRFKTITGQWRREVERETNILIGCEPGEAFKVLNEPEKVDLSGLKVKSASRLARRAYVIAARTDVKELNANQRSRLDHIMGISSRILAAAKIKSKAILPDMTS